MYIELGKKVFSMFFVSINWIIRNVSPSDGFIIGVIMCG